jgi:hypothetical protein
MNWKLQYLLLVKLSKVLFKSALQVLSLKKKEFRTPILPAKVEATVLMAVRNQIHPQMLTKTTMARKISCRFAHAQQQPLSWSPASFETEAGQVHAATAGSVLA